VRSPPVSDQRGAAQRSAVLAVPAGSPDGGAQSAAAARAALWVVCVSCPVSPGSAVPADTQHGDLTARFLTMERGSSAVRRGTEKAHAA
jgi:hypothetical protein